MTVVGSKGRSTQQIQLRARRPRNQWIQSRRKAISQPRIPLIPAIFAKSTAWFLGGRATQSAWRNAEP
jgi:hypothetical protein